MSSSVANGANANANANNGDSSVYANNRGCLPLYKKEFLPHGLCHFYLRHGYCKNRANCRWDHPPLGDRPDYRYVNNDREDGGVHNLGYNGYNEAYSAEGHNKNKKDRKYHNRDDFKSHSDNRDNRDNKSNYKDYHKEAHKDPHTNTSHGLHATHSPHSHGSTSHRANKSNFDSSQYDKDNHRDIAGKFDKYDHHRDRERDRDRDRDRHRDKYHDKPGDKAHLSALPNIIKDHRIHSKHKDMKRDMDRDRNRNRDRNREKDRDKKHKRADKANRDRDRDREKSKVKKVKLETVAYNDTDTEDDDDGNGEMDGTGPSEVEEGEIQEDFVLDALKNTTSTTSTPGHTATASKPKPKGNEQKKVDSKSKDKATTKSTTSTVKKSKKSKLSKAKHDKIKHEKSHKKSTDSTNNSKKSKSKTKTKKKSKAKAKKSTVKKEKESANIVPPPPPPKAKSKPAAKDNEEQISECPDWINKQVCDSFRSCPHFHDGVECDTWVEYGKCPEKENGKCNDFHHRSIWIQTCTKDNSHSHHKDTHSKKDKKNKKEHAHKSSASKKDKATATPTRKGKKEHKSSKVCYDGKERDTVKRMRGVSMASHVSVSSISSTCSDQTRELQVLKVNVARMVKTKRKVYKTELKQMYFDTFAHELNIEEYGYLNIVSFLKSIKCLAMHQGSNGSPLIVYNSANMNNLRYRKINRNRNRNYNHPNNGYQHKMYDDDDYYVNFKNQGYKNRNNYNGNYNNANNGFSQMNKMNPNGYNQNNPYVGNGYESHKKRPFYAMGQHSKFNSMQNQREPPSKKRRKNSF